MRIESSRNRSPFQITTPDKWDLRFTGLARHVAGWSKDPSSRVGAVITTPDHRVVSLGFNGLPRGVADSPDRLLERTVKYQIILHAEQNAILFAARDLRGCVIYTWPFPPCARCAGLIIQSGIVRIVSPPAQAKLLQRWGEDPKLAPNLYVEAGIDLGYVYISETQLAVQDHDQCNRR